MTPRPCSKEQKSLEEAQSLDDAPAATGFALPGASAHSRRGQARRRTGQNVVGYLPATTPVETISRGSRSAPATIISDTAGNTLAGKGRRWQGALHADDNASGSAAVLAVAATLARQPRLAATSCSASGGRGLGLIGSTAFAAGRGAIDSVAAYLNFIFGHHAGQQADRAGGRLLVNMGTDIRQANVAAFDLAVEDPYQPTDVATFNLAACRTGFFTGTRRCKAVRHATSRLRGPRSRRRLRGAIVAGCPTRPTRPLSKSIGAPAAYCHRVGSTSTIPDFSTEVKVAITA